jgi:hypothetical protein
MKLKTYMAGAVLAGFLGTTDLPAQQIEFKTMELHSIGGQSEERVYVDVVHRRHRRRVYQRHYVAKRQTRAHTAAMAGGNAAGGGSGYLYDRTTQKKVVRVE